jgi:transcriptional regulator with XRE-family HTH domain
MMAKRISEQLRQFILDCGESRYALSKRTGVDQPTLSRFVNGERPLTLDKIDTLAQFLNLELTIRKPKRKRKL